jgi:hypothetical protein
MPPEIVELSASCPEHGKAALPEAWVGDRGFVPGEPAPCAKCREVMDLTSLDDPSFTCSCPNCDQGWRPMLSPH